MNNLAISEIKIIHLISITGRSNLELTCTVNIALHCPQKNSFSESSTRIVVVRITVPSMKNSSFNK